ncbi:MAG: hypothetical protein DBX40_07955 [Clostridiales bacterium]|nr:MAG: hypothetical protein DBX40_07955 [Clostridiales bacterium]
MRTRQRYSERQKIIKTAALLKKAERRPFYTCGKATDHTTPAEIRFFVLCALTPRADARTVRNAQDTPPFSFLPFGVLFFVFLP